MRSPSARPQLFREDMAALSVIPPDVFVGAVESIPIIIELIESLHARRSGLRRRR